jgi:hypothetical protein
LGKEEFMNGMNNLFSEDYGVLSRLIFDLYDFNQDGEISRDDINILFSYITIRTKNKNIFKFANEDFKDRIESKEELFKLIEHFFGSNETINFEDFVKSTENKSSESFIYVK